MENNKVFELEKLEYDKANSLRNFEIDLFWKRSWFFGALVLSMITAFYKLKTTVNPIYPPICIAFIGILTTAAQSLMNRGSKYWQERWEYVTKNRESALGIELTKTKMFSKTERFYIDASILSKEENFLTQSRRFSVSKLTFLIWDILSICWILIWLNEMATSFSLNPNWLLTFKIYFFHFVLTIYISLFWIKGEVFQDFMRKELKDKNLKEESENYVQNKNLRKLE